MRQQALGQQVDSNEAAGSSRLRLGITDFGPVSRGTLDLRPLTVLMGPNGCGKSHVATLIHSIINAECETLNPLVLDQKDTFGTKKLVEEAGRIADAHQDGADTVNSDIRMLYIDHKFQVLHEMLSANFSSAHTNLIRLGEKRFELEVKSEIIDGNISCTDVIDANPSEKIPLIVNFGKLVSAQDLDIREILHEDGDSLILDIPYFSNKTTEAYMIRHWLLTLLHVEQAGLERCIYFPAERGGLTLAYKSLTLHFYSSLGMTNANPIDSELTNVSTQFLGLHLMSPDSKTEFITLVERFEENALHGNVIAQENAAKSRSLAFKKDGSTLPLSRSASSVKDLAIFLLYLKHVAKKEETIILEEPETTLHPDNQILLARLIVKLVNAGLRIVVTTHSPYFLEQLSHCVMAGSSQTDKEFREFADDERLNKDSVAAYRFEEDDGGYKMVPITVDKEGIPQHDFVNVSERQYNELLKLEQD